MGESEHGSTAGCVARIVVAALVLLTGAFVAYRLILRAKVNRALDSIRAAGQPVTLQEFVAWRDEHFEGEDATALYEEAFVCYSEMTREEGPLVPIAGYADLPAPAQPMPAEMERAVGEFLSRNGWALEILHMACATGAYRLPQSACDPMTAGRLPALGSMRASTRLLAVDAARAARRGDSDAAVRSLSTALALAECIRREPNLIWQLTRVACCQAAIDSIEDVLSCVSLDDRHLRELSGALERAEDPDAMARAVIGERGWGVSMFYGPRPMFGRVVHAVYGATGLLDIDILTYLSVQAKFLAVLEAPPAQRWELAKPLPAGTPLPRFCVVTGMIAPSFDIPQVDLARICRLRTARAGLAAERYRSLNGELPDGLERLVPEYLESVPTDLFDGKPLRYRKLDKGYLVYSVGPDGQDDGGAERDSADETQPYDIGFRVER